MPTPIEHLIIADEILTSPAFTLRTQLDGDDTLRGAFLFGHIAPDVRVISRQLRRATHFFRVPPTNHRPAHKRMLAAHPALAQPVTLPAAQAAFLAGYLAHLLLDELWIREIFLPIFGPDQTWGDQRERILLHNALRAWLDRRDWPRLPNDLGDLLRQVQPQGWLPFATDADLCRWRDLVADQFEPGATIRTVELFANRARIPDAEFFALLEPDVMEERIFSRISPATLQAFHRRAIARSHDLIIRYLNGCAVGET